MKNKLLKELYDCFYVPPELPAQKQEIEECHQSLIEALEKPERRLVLQIIDAKDRIVEDTSIDSFISGFTLAWKLSAELNNYENERLVSCYTGRPGARFALNSFPAILSMFAIYRLLRPMGLINHRVGLILVYTGTMAVFSLWNTKGYFDTIPTEIEEAAKIDGASDIQVVTKIVMPLAKPSIITTALQVLIYVWNEYIYATTFMTGESKYTLAAGLNSLQATEMTGSWPVFAAASITVSIPVLIIFFKCQKYMTSGLTAGGVKG